MDELIILALTPSPCEVPVEVRLRQLLKTARRRDRLRCVSVVAGPTAWAGWVRGKGGAWIKTTLGISPAIVLRLLAEMPPEDSEIRMVLPDGIKPDVS